MYIHTYIHVFIREKKKGFCIYGCTAVKCKGIRGLTRDRLISSVVHMRVCMYVCMIARCDTCSDHGKDSTALRILGGTNFL